MDTSGQHNLSIALRHILQQFMDSSNSGGVSNTDMTLPHDGYIQRLSWHFECDRCCYKTFYCPEMESHKNTCYAYLDNKSAVKRRKMGVPRRTIATVPPPLEDSDPDNHLFPNSTSQQTDFMASPSPKLEYPTSSVPMEAPSTSSTPAAPVSHSVASPLSVEAPSIEFDAPVASPDYNTPTIPEIEDGSHKALDFDTIPSKETPSVTASVHDPGTVSQSEAAEAFDPDILEIKVEVEPSAEAESAPPPLSTIDTPTCSSDTLFGGAGISDNSVECMMSMFTSSSSQPAPAPPPALHSMSNPSSHRFPSNPPSLHAPHTPPLLRTPNQRHVLSAPTHKPHPHSSTSLPVFHPHSNPSPQFSSLHGSATKAYRKAHPLPQLSMGHLSHIKTPVRPHHTTSATPGSSQPSGIKESLSQQALVQRILCSHGKVVNVSQVRYSINRKHHEKDLGLRLESVMKTLAQTGYGYLIKGRFFKNPRLSHLQLVFYGVSSEEYYQKLLSTKGNHQVAPDKMKELNDLHRSLF
ncbi:uncharacterized protein [Watersipora subatra]|uniref:uncharacterized protein isoform X5 n=1 Tax=Watersipora subatra TaxID=2589382 RepID=UPI00355BBE0B